MRARLIPPSAAATGEEHGTVAATGTTRVRAVVSDARIRVVTQETS